MLDASSTSTPTDAVRRPRLVRADSKLRAKWLLAIGFLALILTLLLLVSPGMQENLIQLFTGIGSESMIKLLVIFYSSFAILAIVCITIGMHLTQVARKIQRYGRFPAPGMRVVRDTWVVHGNKAQFLSYFFIGIAGILAVGGTLIPFYFHELLVQLLATG